MSIIETAELSRRFGAYLAVNQVTLAVEPGQIFGLLGPNGAGKTTLSKMLTTLLPPTAGWAAVAGFDVVRQPMEVRRCIGYVPQALSADGTLTGRRTCGCSPGCTTSHASSAAGESARRWSSWGSPT